MSKVLRLIDYDHLMDYEQLIRIEYMIEKDMEKAGDDWNAIDGFKSYVNPDGLEEDKKVWSKDDIPF
jgi:hypothetical protein